MPIHDNVVIVREGRENDGEELGAFFTSTSLGHPVFPLRLVLCFNEAVEPPISLEIVTHVFEVRSVDIQNKFITNEHIDEELASLQEIRTLELRILKSKGKKKIKLQKDEVTKELPTRME